MSSVGLVASASFKNVFRSKIVPIIMIPIMLICVIGVALLLCVLLIAPEMRSPIPDRATLEAYLGMILYMSSFISIGVTLNSLIFQTMLREKTRGNLAALMSTPLKLSDIWVAKSLAIFVPGLVLGIVLTLISLIIVNVIYFLPDFGFVINWQMVINSFIAVPLIYLFFGLLVHLLGLISKPATANVIAQIFLPLMVNIVIQLAVRNVIDANSWLFIALNFGIVIIILVAVLAVRSRLVPEKVVLSG